MNTCVGGQYMNSLKDLSTLHNEIHNLYTPPHIIKVIKSRRMRGIGNVAHMGR